MIAPTLDIRAYLKGYVGKESIYYKPNQGNGGDSLIALGAYQQFEAVGLNVQTLNEENEVDLTGKTVIYAGGGALTSHYNFARAFVSQWHERVNKLIILPHTVFESDDLIQTFGKNVDLILRERQSYSHISALNPDCNIFLSPDMAFYLDARQIIKTGLPLGWWGYFLRQSVRANQPERKLSVIIFLKVLRNMWQTRPNGNEAILNAFRTDVEQTGDAVPPDNIDVSRLFQYGTQDRTVNHIATYMILEYINRHNLVRTNRLHIAVAGALLGKPVELHPNNYYKNAAIFDYSLRGRYPNVQWMG